MHGLSTIKKLNERFTPEEIAEGARRSAAAQPIDLDKSKGPLPYAEGKPGDPGTV